MKDKNIFVNIVYFVIGALIVLVMGELSEICIDLKQTSYDFRYDYLVMLVEFGGYMILGFWIGIKDIYNEFYKHGKWKLLNYRFILIFVISLISIFSYFIYLKFHLKILLPLFYYIFCAFEFI